MRLILILLLALTSLVSAAASAGSDVIAVIVPLHYAGPSPDTRELSLVFKRKKLFWEDGVRIHPVNLPTGSPVRRLFSQSVLKSLPEQQTQYWNAMYYHGVFPPHVVDSPEAVMRFVADTRGAIGYIPACLVDARVKAVMWIGPSGVASAPPPEMDCAAE